MSVKSIVPIIVILCLAFSVSGCGDGKDAGNTATPAKADASSRCPHEIKQEKCPFCKPELIEADGFCGQHGVAEALCAQCRPFLKAAFRAKGDWCAEHSVPESQCIECNPELKDKIRAGEHGTPTASASSGAPTAPGNCEHGIAQAKCPFCTPSLIQSMGFCDGHNVPEALCVKCNSYMEVAFKAKGDWCAEHNTPESQCVQCNPKLVKPPAGGKG